MKKLLFIGLCFMMLIGTAFAAGQSEKIVFASDATWPPMEFVDEEGEIVGFDIDLANALAEAGGFEIEIRNTAWDGIFAGLASGAYDAIISSVTITDERKASMDFTNAYLTISQIMVVRTETDDVTSADDLKGKKVGVQNGTTGDFFIQDDLGITEGNRKAYDEIGFAIEDLMNGNVDAVVCDSPIAEDYVMSNPSYKGKLKIVGDSLTDENFGIPVQKGKTELLDKLNSALAAVKADGTYEELVDKWLR